MADENKTYSESEHMAILADRVSTETASLTAERDQLLSAKSELENKLDVAESAKVAAEERATNAEAQLNEFKAEVEEREAAAKRKEERLTELRESAKHLGDDFFNDETRVARIVAMKDDEFAGYKADLAATSTGASPVGEQPPRETAMQNGGGQGGSSESTGRSFLLRKFVPQEA